MRVIIIIFLSIIAISFFAGCEHFQEKDAVSPIPAEELYNQAMEQYRSKNYIDAYELFQQCRSRYPISDWGVKAELKMADSLYYQNQYETAFIQYQEFSRLHPTHRFIDYVHYQMGMCSYKQIGSIDRDQTFTEKAIKQFETLIALFPSSPYAPSARKKIEKCKKDLLEHILYIADFYTRTNAYNSALYRYIEALQNYRDYVPSPDRLMFQIGKLCLRVNELAKARDQFIVLLKEYPDSSFAPLAENMLEDPQKASEIDDLQLLTKD